MRKLLAILFLSIFFSVSLSAQISMISQKQRILSVRDITSLEKYVVTKVPSADCSYDEAKRLLSFKVNECGPKESWRLVHDGKRVITLFLSDGITSSIYHIFEADTARKCLDEITRLGLIDDREYKEEEEQLKEKTVEEIK